ncbi:MAG: hypothetical protein K8R69_09245, partial [Deltaproteobacteria bacterium]|nr:hypothetical protein [Deltaproteobacteria bacterium]
MDLRMMMRGAQTSVPINSAAAVEAVLRPALAALPRVKPGLSQEVLDLTEETDPQLMLESCLILARHLEDDGQMESALSIYSALVETGRKDPRLIVGSLAIARAQSRLDAILGKGGFGARSEFLISRFTAQATDYRTILPMMAGSLVGQLAKTWVLGAYVQNAGRIGAMGLEVRLVSGAAALTAEVPVFSLGSRALQQWSGEPVAWDANSVERDFVATALTLGALKISGTAAQGLSGSLKDLGNREVLAQSVLPHGAMFVGMLGAHHLETFFGLKKKTDDATVLTDTLASLFSLNVGSSLGRRFLGPRFANLTAELELRSQAMAGGGYVPTILEVPAAGPRISAVLNKPTVIEELSRPLQMAAMKNGEGGRGRAPSLAAELRKTEGEIALDQFLDSKGELSTLVEWMAEGANPYGRVYVALNDIQNPETLDRLARGLRLQYLEKLEAKPEKAALHFYAEIAKHLSPGSAEALEAPPIFRRIFSDDKLGYYLRREALVIYARLVEKSRPSEEELKSAAAQLIQSFQAPPGDPDWRADALIFYRRLLELRSPDAEEVKTAMNAIRPHFSESGGQVPLSAALGLYQKLLEEFPPNRASIGKFSEVLREKWTSPDPSIRLHSLAASFQVQKLFLPGDPWIYHEASAMRGLFLKPPLDTTAVEYYMGLARLFRSEDGEALREEFEVLNDWIRPEAHAQRPLPALESEKIISTLIQNFTKFDAMGLWETWARSIGDGEWGLAKEDIALLQGALYDNRGKLMKARDQWRALLRYLSDIDEPRRAILHLLLESGGKPRDIFSALDAVLMIPEEYRSELTLQAGEKLRASPKTVKAGALGRAKLLKEFIQGQLMSRLGELLRSKKYQVRFWEDRTELLSALYPSGTLGLFLRAAGFMDAEGRALLGDVLDELALSEKLVEPMILPLRYRRLMQQGFHPDFLEVWAREYERGLEATAQDLPTVRAQVLSQGMSQIRRHLNGAKARTEGGLALFDRVESFSKGEGQELADISREIEVLLENFERDYGGIRFEFGDRFANIRTDLRILRQGMRINAVLAGEHRVYISGSVQEMARVGSSPEETCQRLTALWDFESNGRGQPLNRIRYGQFKTAVYRVDQQILARRLVELTRNESGEAVLLVHRLYADGRFASAPSF